MKVYFGSLDKKMPCIFQTQHNFSDPVSWAITIAVSLSASISEREPTDLQLALSTLPHLSCFHFTGSIKAEIKRLAGQREHNESSGEPFASGLLGLQRMWYLDRMRSGFISKRAGPSRVRRASGLPAWDAGLDSCIILQANLIFEWREMCWQPILVCSQRLHNKFQQVCPHCALLGQRLSFRV